MNEIKPAATGKQKYESPQKLKLKECFGTFGLSREKKTFFLEMVCHKLKTSD